MVKPKTYLLQYSPDFMSLCIKGSEPGETASPISHWSDQYVS